MTTPRSHSRVLASAREARARLARWASACLLGPLLAAGCTTTPAGPVYHQASGDGARPRAHPVAPVQVLGASVERLAQAFNEAQGRPRVIALLSPTCPRCESACESIRGALESAPDGVEPEVFVVWLEVFAVDDVDACRCAMARFAGIPVQGFVDDLRMAGRLLTRGRLPIGVARHLFLWYGPEARWDEGPPKPAGWGHQLKRHDPRTFCPLSELEGRLVDVFRGIDE